MDDGYHDSEACDTHDVINTGDGDDKSGDALRDAVVAKFLYLE